MKNWKTNFSAHAAERLQQRIGEKPEEIARILDEDLAVTIGAELSTSRCHRLFFSVRDQKHFVAIQDITNGEVITFLPLDYHENFGWKISDRDFQESTRLMAADHPSLKNTEADELKKYKNPVVTIPVSVLKVAGLLLDDDGSTTLKNLGSWPLAKIENIESLGNDMEFVSEIRDRIKKKGLNPLKINSLYVRVRDKDIPTTIEMRYTDDVMID